MAWDISQNSTVAGYNALGMISADGIGWIVTFLVMLLILLGVYAYFIWIYAAAFLFFLGSVACGYLYAVYGQKHKQKRKVTT